MLTRQQAVRGAQNFVLIFFSIGIVALYSSWRRPIWYDEWLHFLWGAFPVNFATWKLVWQATSIDPTTCCDGCCAVASTPTYMILNNIALGLFGAREEALRFPSYLSTAFLTFAIIWFFRSKGIGFIWQLAALLVLGIHADFMYYGGEARSYMPMVAGIAGFATYYTADLAQRKKRPVRAIGWISAIFFSLFHPYVALYAILISITFATLFLSYSKDKKISVSFGQLLNIPLIGTTTGFFLLFYFFGWGPGQPQGRDPFLYVPQNGFFQAFVSYIFGPYLREPLIVYGVFVFIALITVLTFVRLQKGKADMSPRYTVLPPLALFCNGIASGIALVLAATISQTPFIPRYWLGSGLLITLAILWGLANLSKTTFSGLTSHQLIGRIPPAILIAFLILPSFRALQEQLTSLQEYEKEKNRLGLLLLQWGAVTPKEALDLAEFPEQAANFNLYLGGPIPSEFQSFMVNHGLPSFHRVLEPVGE